MPVLQVPAGEEGGPEGLSNFLKEKEDEEDMQDSLAASHLTTCPVRQISATTAMWQELLKKVHPV